MGKRSRRGVAARIMSRRGTGHLKLPGKMAPVVKRSAGKMFPAGHKSPIQYYPRPQFAALDSALGRGYRLGDQVSVPALSGAAGGGQATLLVNHGLADHVFRWKISLAVELPQGVVDPPTNGMRLRFNIYGKAENDLILRRPSVSVGDGQVLYVHGRSLFIEAINPTTQDMVAHYNLDEASPGLSTWEDSEVFSALVAETPLDISPFTSVIVVLSPSSAVAAPILRGYAPGGTLVYRESLAVPRSATVPRVPGLDYTLTPTVLGVAQTHAVFYQCVG